MSEQSLILIAGASGSGKSTVSRLLCEEQPEVMSVVHFDDFQFDADTLVPDEDGFRNWDEPAFTNFEDAYKKLKDLKNGRYITLQAKNEYDNPEYIRGNFRRLPIEVKPKRICIAEGHYALLDERVRALSDLSIFLSLDFNSSTARRTKLSTSKYDERYLLPMHEKFVYPTAEFADEVLDINGLDLRDTLELIRTRIQERGIEL
jgi:uridine kinase